MCMCIYVDHEYELMYVYERCYFLVHIRLYTYKHTHTRTDIDTNLYEYMHDGYEERWGAGVETQKNVRGEIGGWGRVPLNEPYAPSLSTIYDGA